MPPYLNANDATQAEGTPCGPRTASSTAWQARAFALGYGLLCVLYSAVAYLSLGYDDEFTNMGLVERLGLGVVSLMQTEDVHPPGSYFINWLLHAITGDWSLVRLATALMTAGALVYATEAIRQRHGNRAAALLFVLLCLNPAILMWCTGVRWYAYFVPVLVWLSITPTRDGWRYWGKCFGGLVVLGYLGYAVFVVALPVLWLYWTGTRQSVRERLVGIAWAAPLAALLYAYQFHIFLTVHLQSKGSQVSSMTKNLMGFAIAQISNQGVFPVSVPALLSALGLSGMVALAFALDARGNLRNRYLHAYGLGVAATLATGLAGKFRNLVIVSPWQALWLATLRVPPARARLFLACFAALALGNLWGVFNVATHQNTTKNSWDLQLAPVLADLQRQRAACGGDLVVVAHDPALNWHVDVGGYPQLGPFSRQTLPADVLAAPHRCVAVVRSYAGMFDTATIDRMYAQADALRHAGEARQLFGRDANYRIKQRLDGRYPQYQFDITIYRNVTGLDALTAWQPLSLRNEDGAPHGR